MIPIGLSTAYAYGTPFFPQFLTSSKSSLNPIVLQVHFQQLIYSVHLSPPESKRVTQVGTWFTITAATSASITGHVTHWTPELLGIEPQSAAKCRSRPLSSKFLGWADQDAHCWITSRCLAKAVIPIGASATTLLGASTPSHAMRRKPQTIDLIVCSNSAWFHPWIMRLEADSGCAQTCFNVQLEFWTVDLQTHVWLNFRSGHPKLLPIPGRCHCCSRCITHPSFLWCRSSVNQSNALLLHRSGIPQCSTKHFLGLCPHSQSGFPTTERTNTTSLRWPCFVVGQPFEPALLLTC